MNESVRVHVYPDEIRCGYIAKPLDIESFEPTFGYTYEEALVHLDLALKLLRIGYTDYPENVE